MNKADVIHKLEFMRDAYQKLIDENVDEGRLVGTDVTGTWKADTPLNKVYAEHVEALNLAISALDKQIPQKPEMIWDTTFGKIRPHCLVCGASNPTGANYCWNCGQRFIAEEES